MASSSVPQPTNSQIISDPAAQAASGQTLQENPADTNKPSFTDQVKGYAKEFAGKTFGKEHEQAQGEAVRKGQADPATVKEDVPKEAFNSDSSTTSSKAA